MTVAENKNLVRHVIDQVWNGRREDLAAEFFTGPMLEEALHLHALLIAAFPDLTIKISDLIAEDDKVAARLTFSGTHSGKFRGQPPTGKTFSFEAIRIYRFVDGKAVESFAVQDQLGLMRQLGLTP